MNYVINKQFNSGFSLIELLIVLFVFSILLGITYASLNMGHLSYQSGDIKIVVQQETRKAMNKIVTELREAHSVNMTDEYPFSIWDEKIKYEVVNNQLQKTVEGGAVTILANNVGNIQFSLSGGDVVYITMVAQKNTILGHSLSTALTSQVKLRN